MNGVLISLGVTVIILMYILYLYVYSSSTTLSTLLNLNTASGTETKIPITSIPNASNFAIGFWIYVNTPPSSASTSNSIISMTGGNGTDNSSSLFNLILNNTTMKLIMGLSSTPQTITITTNFPLQKWTYVTFSVDGTFVDTYWDGKLIQSAKLTQTLNLPTSAANIYIGYTGLQVAPTQIHLDMMMAKLYRWTNPLSPSDVWTQYLYGNGQRWTGGSQYGMNVGILQNNAQTASYRIL